MPILARWPGMTRVVLHTPLEWDDPFPVNRGRAVLLAQLEFESREDFKRFPPFSGTVTHQAMESVQAWRRTA